MSKGKGLDYYFNSTTNYGRANVAKATLGAVAAGVLYFKFLKGEKVNIMDNGQ